MGKNKVTTQSGDVAKKGAAIDAAVEMGRQEIKEVEKGKVYINASYNNTVVTVTDTTGNVLAWASAGSLGFQVRRKQRRSPRPRSLRRSWKRYKQPDPRKLTSS